jgi:hypothetical protein
VQCTRAHEQGEDREFYNTERRWRRQDCEIIPEFYGRIFFLL